MFCVCERSRAASTSSRMYMGAGLNWSRAMMRERAMRELPGEEGDNVRCRPGQDRRWRFEDIYGKESGGWGGERLWIFGLTVDHRSVPSGFASTPCRG